MAEDRLQTVTPDYVRRLINFAADNDRCLLAREGQHVGLRHRELGKDKPSCLAARQARQLLLDLVSRKEHLAEPTPYLTGGLAGAGGSQPALDRGITAFEYLAVVLGKVTDMHGRPLDFGSDYKMRNNRGVVVSNGTIHPAVLEVLKRSI